MVAVPTLDRKNGTRAYSAESPDDLTHAATPETSVTTWPTERLVGAAMAGTATVSCCAPAIFPSVQAVCARPASLVVATRCDTEPAPWVTAKLTVTPGAGAPLASTTFTITGSVSAAPTAPLRVSDE